MALASADATVELLFNKNREDQHLLGRRFSRQTPVPGPCNLGFYFFYFFERFLPHVSPQQTQGSKQHEKAHIDIQNTF